MKNILLIFAILYGLTGVAQNFTPFKKDVSKRFFNPKLPKEDDYFFHSTKDTIVGDSLIFYQYYTIQELKDQPNDSNCYDQTRFFLDTTWLGNQVIYNQNSKTLYLENEKNELLSFNFGLELNDSSVFYLDQDLVYFIKYASISDEEIFGIREKVKHFQINAFDNVGNKIDTAITGATIKLSENLGILSFIDCYNFPRKQKLLELRGQSNPLLGNYQLSMAQIYPWKAGDLVQFKGCELIPHTGYEITTYEKITVTSREETDDSVKIYFNSEVHNIYDPEPIDELKPVLIGLTSPISFNKNDFVLELPHNIGIQEEKFKNVNFFGEEIDDCNNDKKINLNGSFFLFCEPCRCYVGYDAFNQRKTLRTYSANKGPKHVIKRIYGDIQDDPMWNVKQIYSKINGIECGKEWILGIENHSSTSMKIFPIPSSGNLSVELTFIPKLIFVTDLFGRELYSSNKNLNSHIQINLEILDPGSYFLWVKDFNGNSITKRIIIQ